MEPLTMAIIAGLISLGNVIKSKIEKEEKEEAERRRAQAKADEEAERRRAQIKASEDAAREAAEKAKAARETLTKQMKSAIVSCEVNEVWKSWQNSGNDKMTRGAFEEGGQ